MITKTCIMRQRPVTHSSLLGETLTRSATFHGLTQATAQLQEEGSPRQRRITVGERCFLTLSIKFCETKTSFSFSSVSLCLSCSIIHASVEGSEWKLPWEGTVLLTIKAGPSGWHQHTAQSRCNYRTYSVYISQLPWSVKAMTLQIVSGFESLCPGFAEQDCVYP